MSLLGVGSGGQAVSSPLLECQCDAHWEELDWKISDSNRSQKDVAASELEPEEVSFLVSTEMRNRFADHLFS